MKRFLKFAFISAFALIFSGCLPAGGEDELTDASISEIFASVSGNGWNLGNTLDACTYDSGKGNIGIASETSWGAPLTTAEMIKAVHERGFSKIRIPVSWHNHIIDENYTIDSDWMDRVKEVVDWAYNDGMKVIINIHHDNLSDAQMSNNAGFCVSTNAGLQEKSKAYIEAVWTQISDVFKEYDEKLIFEVLNEPRAVGTWYEWGGSGSEVKAANNLIKQYEQIAVDAIRASGGKNTERYIMVPPYAASPNMIDGWSLPSDTGNTSGKNRLLVSVHAYTPYNFAMGKDSDKTFSDTGSIDYLFNIITDLKKGAAGVVLGEASASDKNNLSERIKWANYYSKKADKANVPVLLWDNMSTVSNGGKDPAERHGYFNRKNLTWFF